MWALLGLLLVSLPLFAQLPVCTGTAMWTPCELGFDLEANEKADQVRLQAEFQSPRHRTYLLKAFHDSDRKLVIRFAPTEAGEWKYKITSSLDRLNGQEATFTTANSDAPGFIHLANVHHFQSDNGKPHLWMGTALDKFATLPRPEFDRLVDQHATEKFTHLRVTLQPDTDLGEAVERVKSINAKGMIADLVIDSLPQDRERYITDVAARFSALDITWTILPEFETVDQARPMLKTVGDLLTRNDPYHHPRTAGAQFSSAPLSNDGWLDYLSYGTPDPNVGAVEHQFYQRPAVNAAIRSRADLWNATMNGQYPASGSGQYMTTWFEFMSGNRYWDFEPYFDLDGGRAIALEDTEYIVYQEKPGPVDVRIEKHSYQVFWINPETGERTKMKDINAERYTGGPPDSTHDWVLHLVREGHKESLKSYRFESRMIPIQDIEVNPEKIPFEVDVPSALDVSLKSPPYFGLKVTRDTRATRSILVEWTGEVTIAGQGYRVIGTGKEGTFRIPSNLTPRLPASLAVRVMILNANGKAYAIDKVYRLVE